ncbi:MAG: hypothetical protein ACOVK2_04810 [Candidatus Fonsibacter sp.]
MTAIDQLIEDMQELKKTKLYASSFKAIDDCIFLANYHKKTEKEQIIAFLKWVGDGYDFQNNAKEIVNEYYNETFKIK